MAAAAKEERKNWVWPDSDSIAEMYTYNCCRCEEVTDFQ